jgi:hypothetical protein
VLRREGAMVLGVSGYGGVWHLRTSFSDHDRVPTAREYVRPAAWTCPSRWRTISRSGSVGPRGTLVANGLYRAAHRRDHAVSLRDTTGSTPDQIGRHSFPSPGRRIARTQL